LIHRVTAASRGGGSFSFFRRKKELPVPEETLTAIAPEPEAVPVEDETPAASTGEAVAQVREEAPHETYTEAVKEAPPEPPAQEVPAEASPAKSLEEPVHDNAPKKIFGFGRKKRDEDVVEAVAPTTKIGLFETKASLERKEQEQAQYAQRLNDVKQALKEKARELDAGRTQLEGLRADMDKRAHELDAKDAEMTREREEFVRARAESEEKLSNLQNLEEAAKRQAESLESARIALDAKRKEMDARTTDM
jgi:hypothetical protein